MQTIKKGCEKLNRDIKSTAVRLAARDQSFAWCWNSFGALQSPTRPIFCIFEARFDWFHHFVLSGCRENDSDSCCL